MSALKLVMTTVGLGRFTAAQAGDDIDLTIARVGLTNAAFVAAPSLTALPGEFRRLSTVSGSVELQNIVHMTVTDDGALSYSLCGFGLFLTDGTLFAAYSQAGTIAEKSTGSMLALAIDIAFPVAGVEQITFGSTSFLNPPASTERKGVVELATLAEASAGDATRATTGDVVKAMIADAITAVGQALAGITSRTFYGAGLVKGGGDLTASRTFTVDAATGADCRGGNRGDLAVTPAALTAAGIIYLVESRADGANWYRRYSDGVTEMSGVAPLPVNEATFTLVFPWPFAAACEGLWSTIINRDQTNDGQSTVQEVVLAADRATLFAQNHKSPTTDAAGGFRWFARGR